MDKQTAGTGHRFFPWCTGVGRVASPLRQPVLAFAGDAQSFDELEHVTPATAKGARVLERRHGRHRQLEVGRWGHHRRTDLLCKSYEVVDPQAKIVVYHLMTARAAEPESRIILLRVCRRRSADTDVKAASIVTTLSRPWRSPSLSRETPTDRTATRSGRKKSRRSATISR